MMSSVQKLGVLILFFYNNFCTWFMKIIEVTGEREPAYSLNTPLRASVT